VSVVISLIIVAFGVWDWWRARRLPGAAPPPVLTVVDAGVPRI